MDFRHAYFEMLNGKPIRRPDWGGFWCFEKNTIMIYTKDFEQLDIRETNNIPYTFSHICEKDWEVCSDEYMEQYNARWLAKLNLNKELPEMVQAG